METRVHVTAIGAAMAVLILAMSSVPLGPPRSPTGPITPLVHSYADTSHEGNTGGSFESNPTSRPSVATVPPNIAVEAIRSGTISNFENNSSFAPVVGAVADHLLPPPRNLTRIPPTHFSAGWGLFDTSVGALVLSNGGQVLAWYNLSNYAIATVANNSDSMALDSKSGLVFATDRASDSVHVLSLANGTPLAPAIRETNVTSPSKLLDTREIVYDAANGLMYVVSPPGVPFITIVNSTSVVGTIPLSSNFTFGSANEVFDPVDGDVYVNFFNPNIRSMSVMVLNGTGVVGNLTLPANGSTGYAAPMSVFDPANRDLYFETQLNGSIPGLVVVNASETNGSGYVGLIHCPGMGGGGYFNNEPGFNPMNQEIYVPSLGNYLTAIKGLSVVGNVSDPAGPTHVYYFPASGAELASDAAGIAVISTFLSESLIAQVPTPDPDPEIESGVNSTLTSHLAGTGDGNVSFSIESYPANRVACNESFVKGTIPATGDVIAACTGIAPGNTTIWVNGTDGLASVWTRISETVYSRLAILRPVAVVAGQAGAVAADVGQTVQFVARPLANDSTNITYDWNNLPVSAQCGATATSILKCVFYAIGNLSISVSAIDGLGAKNTSPALVFQVYPRLLAETIRSSQQSADIGQVVDFLAVAVGGAGNLSASFVIGISGSSCQAVGPLSMSCTFSLPGPYLVQANVTDANRNTQLSPPFTEGISSPPSAGSTAANRDRADVGQTVRFWANFSSSVGIASYAWSGLPGPCQAVNSSSPTCSPSSSGAFKVSARATDIHSGLSNSSTSVLVNLSPRLSVSALTVSSPSTNVGSLIWLNATVTGGWGPIEYLWSGLPIGCSGGATASVQCRPEMSSTIIASLRVEDGNAEVVNSSAVKIVVSPSPGNSYEILGIDPVFVAAAAILVAGAALAVVGEILRRRRSELLHEAPRRVARPPSP